MRIITGDFKGRKLNTFRGNSIRPTPDKVKEAIFSMIGAYLGDSVVLDLFAGTGNLGLEALSRGASMCYFGDNSSESVRLIKQNIGICQAEDMSKVIAGSFEKVIASLPEKVDIIFLDPPYTKGLMEQCFEKIKELEILNEDGIIVAERSLREALPDELSGFEKIKERRYGTILVSLFS